ncbi:MAG TPA: 4-(cytidine 5'-diphospho)-2-C-methyl-D-erythritol kinase [Blastocatellia bacterium]|nr:4-(cytidine 5'-diphospho)-2-C-methyl-D-erythritol kinase [Blastocatellia bacterium]
MSHSIAVRSYAKINWSLEVLSRRADGYHEIRTVFQTVSLFDTLRISRIESGIEIECNDPDVPVDETNLVHKAVRQLNKRWSGDLGLRVEIEKRIPVAGGLGGGSSNAAAAVLAADKLLRLGLSEIEQSSLAAELGSDVSFFLSGGTMLGTGRGEKLQQLEDIDCPNIVLANPRTLVSTARAYENFSRLTRPGAARMIPFNLLAAGGTGQRPPELRNDLEEAVIAFAPEIGELKQRLLSLGAQGVLMCGSGATVFGVFDKLETSELAVSEIEKSGAWASRVRTIGRQEYRNSLFERRSESA